MKFLYNLYKNGASLPRKESISAIKFAKNSRHIRRLIPYLLNLDYFASGREISRYLKIRYDVMRADLRYHTGKSIIKLKTKSLHSGHMIRVYGLNGDPEFSKKLENTEKRYGQKFE